MSYGTSSSRLYQILLYCCKIPLIWFPLNCARKPPLGHAIPFPNTYFHPVVICSHILFLFSTTLNQKVTCFSAFIKVRIASFTLSMLGMIKKTPRNTSIHNQNQKLHPKLLISSQKSIESIRIILSLIYIQRLSQRSYTYFRLKTHLSGHKYFLNRSVGVLQQLEINR